MCTCRDSKRERISDAVFTLVQHGGKGPEKYLPQGFSESWHTFVPKLVKLLLRNHVAFSHVQSTYWYSEISTLECFFTLHDERKRRGFMFRNLQKIESAFNFRIRKSSDNAEICENML